MAIVQPKIAAALRQLEAVEWLEQLTQVTATVQPKLPAAARHQAAVE